MKNPYEARHGSDGKYYVSGPAPGGECSYYGGTLYPESRFETLEEAQKAATFANIGFQQGYEQAQRDIRKALGLKE